MRTHKLLAAFVALLFGLVLSTGVSYAQDDTTPEPVIATDEPITPISAVEEEVGEEVEAEEGEISHVGHCIEEAHEAGTDPEECVEAPNPILPETNEIIWGGAAFLILLVLMWWKLLPPIKQGMADRTDRIRGDLDRAEAAKVEAEEVLVQYQAQVADAKAEANRIIEEARATADSLKAELAKRAEAEIAEMKARAAVDVEASKAQAMADLRGEVATLALGAAEMVVQKSLDQDTQIALIENYINQVGTGN